MALSKASSKISPCLWFNDQGEDAAKFYVNIFNTAPHAEDYPASSITDTTHYMEDAKQVCTDFEPGKALTVLFTLAGQNIMALNGGPIFQFTHAISFMIECADQEEVDHFYGAFTEGKADRELNCGWCKDKYGLSWQVVPRLIREMVENEPDRVKYNRLHVWMMNTPPKKFVLEDMKSVMEEDSPSATQLMDN